jgi:hypothetical protein
VRPQQPFQPDDLEDLDVRLLSKAHAVVSMREVYAGNRHPDVIAVRHDVDDNPGSLKAAVSLAQWEAERGYRSTYYLLHDTSYWADTDRFRESVVTIGLAGHEVGIHVNGLAVALRTGRDAHAVLEAALAELRGYGVTVTGAVGHGDPLCPQLGFANDEQFTECARPKEGPPDRMLNGKHSVRISPRPLADFGLTYESVRLGRGHYNTDSGGKWYEPFDDTVAWWDTFHSLGGAQLAANQGSGQLHLLVHPDWWTEAFP